jgi:hypothetical protein
VFISSYLWLNCFLRRAPAIERRLITFEFMPTIFVPAFVSFVPSWLTFFFSAERSDAPFAHEARKGWAIVACSSSFEKEFLSWRLSCAV